ncbi:hypothetical protein [Desulfohalovibrio reitneri]|uniref:hypothetical protein n=1 Tax=Desulfohalovibrio reitneri TaxID=1307759 RepID=UPI0004A74B6A|nr:hypothetical protein [Desulfohalovibrio reitneri]
MRGHLVALGLGCVALGLGGEWLATRALGGELRAVLAEPALDLGLSDHPALPWLVWFRAHGHTLALVGGAAALLGLVMRRKRRRR